ncbi:pyridoxamine 5'-phosphate oxidase family protein [Ekhidna sp.]|uniref:pyridoxamine 5'-phosphate oxidase family protein n=1 Tax=Ekhidna sp. TaxID=2608089 RepID=UPI003BA8DD4E
MELRKDWKIIRKYFKQYNLSSMHCAMATVNPDGTPWVTPIGSLLLNNDCTGIYFEIFTRGMPKNLNNNRRIVVMGVNSSFIYWIKSVLFGKFSTPPALRLVGTAGQVRRATELEKRRIQKLLATFKRTAGYKKMWSRLEFVRDITFEKVIPVNLGDMTPGAVNTGKKEKNYPGTGQAIIKNQ